MIFKNFLEIAKTKYPDAEFSQHGCVDKNKLSVLVIFNSNNPRAERYQYTGTYCEVLNKLGIPAMYKRDFESRKEELSKLIEQNGTLGFFNKVVDNTERITEIEAEIEAIQQGKIIIV